MLTQVRDTLKGAVAWVIIILLVAAFALWQVPSVTQLLSNAAVKVGGESFSQQYVSREFDQTFQRAVRESGGDYTREQAIASGLSAQVVESIVTKSALSQYAEKMNLAIPREAIADFIAEIDTFKNPATGEVDRQTLESILLQNGLTVGEFEQMLRDDLTRSQLVEALATSTPAPRSFLDPLILRETERRRIAYITVTEDMAGVAAEPTPDDLQTFYEENAGLFTAPEYRTFDLLTLRKADFRQDLEAPEEEMRRLYEAGRDRIYATPERRTVYQLTYETEAEAQAAAADLQQGKTFEALAAEKGMSLEAATFANARKRDLLDPAVADAAFGENLEAGAVLDPVRSLFGWTVVQLVDVTPGESRSFEEVRPELEEAYLENDVRNRVQDAIDAIEEARDTGAELSEAAEEAGFEVVTVGPVDRLSFAPGGAIVDKVPGEALAEAFILSEGDQSEAMRLSGDQGYFFVALHEIRAPALKPYDEVEDEVMRRWRDRERRERIAATVASIKEQVGGDKTFEDVAAEFGRAPIELVIDRRFENDVINQAFNEAIFFADLEGLVSANVGASGAQAVAEVREIGFQPGSLPPAAREQLASLVGRQLDQEMIEAFVVAIRDDYGVKINQSQLDTIFGDQF
jgi:peptidyl-prolyl cis-trans isomerase D